MPDMLEKLEARDRLLAQAILGYLDGKLSNEEEELLTYIDKGVVFFGQLPCLFRPREKLVVRYLCGEALYGSTMSSCAMLFRDGTLIFELVHESLCYDGKHLGRIRQFTTVPFFEGVRSIHELDVSPLRCHPDRYELRKTLILQGQTYTSTVKNPCCMLHQGTAFTTSPEGTAAFQNNGPVLLGRINFLDRRTDLAQTPEGCFVALEDPSWPDTLSSEDLYDCLPHLPALIPRNRKKSKV